MSTTLSSLDISSPMASRMAWRNSISGIACTRSLSEFGPNVAWCGKGRCGRLRTDRRNLRVGRLHHPIDLGFSHAVHGYQPRPRNQQRIACLPGFHLAVGSIVDGVAPSVIRVAVGLRFNELRPMPGTRTCERSSRSLTHRPDVL